MKHFVYKNDVLKYFITGKTEKIKRLALSKAYKGNFQFLFEMKNRIDG